MQTYISTDQSWALWAVLFCAAAFGLWAERTGPGSRLSGAAVTLLCTFLLSNLNIIPSRADTYDLVWHYLVPLAIPLLLVNADLRRILIESGPTLLAFVIGAVTTVIGTLIAYSIVPLGSHDWQLAAVFSASHIGSSINFTSTARAVGLHDRQLLEAGIAVSQLLIIIYFMILFSLPTLYRLRARFFERPDRHRLATEVILRKESRTGERINLPGITTAIAISLIICSIAFEVEKRLGHPGSALLIITLASIGMASLFKPLMKHLDGAMETGTLLMLILFATIGASANITTALKAGPALLSFAAIILIVHLLLILLIGKYARLSLPEILIASNAGIGSTATAVGMAAARRWHALMVPAVLCGTLGYLSSDWIGKGIAQLLH